MNASKIILSLSLMSLFGCPAKDEPVLPVERPKAPATVTDLGTMPVDHPEIESLDVLSRGPRRMSVEQIERSVEVIIGGIPEGNFNLDPTLALTLGEPDYLSVTDESLEPTPLYMKFMMDLGAYVCQAVRDFDPQRPVEERVITRYAENKDQNIRYILLRFTGIDGAEADPYVARLSRVFDAGRSGPLGDASGWEAVCLAVFTSPEFLLY